MNPTQVELSLLPAMSIGVLLMATSCSSETPTSIDESGLSAAMDEQLSFELKISDDTAAVFLSIEGSDGNADLSATTLATEDEPLCPEPVAGSNEQCVILGPQAGEVLDVSISTQDSFSGLTFKASQVPIAATCSKDCPSGTRCDPKTKECIGTKQLAELCRFDTPRGQWVEDPTFWDFDDDGTDEIAFITRDYPKDAPDGARTVYFLNIGEFDCSMQTLEIFRSPEFGIYTLLGNFDADAGYEAFLEDTLVELDGTVLWTLPDTDTYYGNAVSAEDLDGDGVDEILTEYALIDAKGSALVLSDRDVGQDSWFIFDGVTADINGDGTREMIYSGVGLTSSGELDFNFYNTYVAYDMNGKEIANDSPETRTDSLRRSIIAIGDVNADGRDDVIINGTDGLHSMGVGSPWHLPLPLGEPGGLRVTHAEVIDADSNGENDVVLSIRQNRGFASTVDNNYVYNLDGDLVSSSRGKTDFALLFIGRKFGYDFSNVTLGFVDLGGGTLGMDVADGDHDGTPEIVKVKGSSVFLWATQQSD